MIPFNHSVSTWFSVETVLLFFVVYDCHLDVCDQVYTGVKKTFFPQSPSNHKTRIVSRSNNYIHQKDNRIRQVVPCIDGP